MEEWEELTKYSKQFHIIASWILSHICYGIPNTYGTHSFYAYNAYFLHIGYLLLTNKFFQCWDKVAGFHLHTHRWTQSPKSLFSVAFSSTFLPCFVAQCISSVWSLLLTAVWIHVHASVRGLSARQRLECKRCARQVTNRQRCGSAKLQAQTPQMTVCRRGVSNKLSISGPGFILV